MNWLDTYKAKLSSPARALDEIRSGTRVWVHAGCATPQFLLQQLRERGRHLWDVEMMHMLTLGDAWYVEPEWEGHFRLNSLFIGGNARAAVSAGHADYTPIFLSEIEGLLSGDHRPDVVLCQVSPPDDHGFVSLGVSVDCTLTAARNARVVIAEVNDRMPRALGDAFLHVSEVTHFVEVSHPLYELRPEPCDDVQHRIAENVASLIPDGATLQLGIGAVPDAVLRFLVDRRDLGVHSEMVSDGVIDLIEAGMINGRRKSIHPGKVVAGFVLGTQALFDYLHNNPFFEFHPIRYTNDPFVIAQNDRMVAINSALQVDLTGQICADSLGTRPYSGFGGQVDFIRGAARSRGGKPIVAMPSTAKHGTVTRIAPTLDAGAGVVTSRADVHYVVTEHGVAYLHGKTLRERAEALIAIADPQFRDELWDFAERSHYVEPKGVLV